MSDLREGMPSVASVQDPEARQILEHILKNMQVRAGNVGDGENAYVTRKDLRATGVSIARFGDNSKATGNNVSPESVRDRLEALLGTDIQAIQDAIAASPSFQLLGNPIASIGNGAQIADVRRTMNNNFASFAQLSTTLQAQIGTQRVSILQNAEAVADLDGKASAQWYVKTDINGAVAGFGLFSTARNGAVSSEFYVRADKFAIGSPEVPRAQNPDGSYQAASPAELPFVVFSTPQIINRKEVLPGVYMRRTFIHDGAIQNAMIGAAAINTLEIAGEAVTVPVTAIQSGSVTIPSGAAANSEYSLVSASVTYDNRGAPSNTFIFASFNYAPSGPTGNMSIALVVKINGTLLNTSYTSFLSGFGGSLTFAYRATSGQMGEGTHTIEIFASPLDSPGASISVSNGSILSLGAKK